MSLAVFRPLEILLDEHARKPAAGVEFRGVRSRTRREPGEWGVLALIAFS
jgi:hypothetical protein